MKQLTAQRAILDFLQRSSSVSVQRRLVGSSLSQPAGLEIQAGGAPSLSQEIICIMFLAYVPPV